MPASREGKNSEKLLKKAFEWFPSLFTEVWFLAGGTIDNTSRQEWQDNIFQKIDYVIENLVDLKRAIREEYRPDFGEKKLT